MADWVDSYIDTTLYGSGELDRLFKAYEMGSISRKYLLGLFGMTEEAFDAAANIQRGQSIQCNESQGPGCVGGQGDGVRSPTP